MWRYEVPRTMEAAIRELRQRRGIIRVSPEVIEEMLRLPEGFHVIGVHAEPITDSIAVGVYSDSLPVIPEGGQPEFLHALYTRNDDGTVSVQIGGNNNDN